MTLLILGVNCVYIHVKIVLLKLFVPVYLSYNYINNKKNIEQ